MINPGYIRVETTGVLISWLPLSEEVYSTTPTQEGALEGQVDFGLKNQQQIQYKDIKDESLNDTIAHKCYTSNNNVSLTFNIVTKAFVYTLNWCKCNNKSIISNSSLNCMKTKMIFVYCTIITLKILLIYSLERRVGWLVICSFKSADTSQFNQYLCILNMISCLYLWSQFYKSANIFPDIFIFNIVSSLDEYSF